MAVLRILRDPWVGGIIGFVAAALIFVFAGRLYVAFRTPHWIAQLRDPDPGERRIAALYLNEFAQPTDAVLRAFMTAMEDRHVGVRQQAAAGLAKFGSAGRMSHFSGPPNVPRTILTHTWDPSGNRTSLAASIDGFGTIVNNYQYDALNRTTRIEQSGKGVTDKRVDLAYNGLGQFTRIKRFGDLGGTQLVASSTYGYDTLARLTSLAHSRPSTIDPQPSTVAAYAWSYDALSRITFMTTPDGTGNYSYDPTSQLVAEDYDSFQPDQSHTWDLNGNPVGPGFLVGPNNQLLETPTHEYQYDGEGNRIREIDKATGKIRHFEWDHRNRLVEVRDELGGSGGTAVSAVSAYRYHPLTNYRISKDVRAFDPATGDLVDRVFEAYVHDGAEIVFATDENELVTDLYLDGQMLMDMHLANEKFDPARVSQATYWSLWDHQWSVRDVVDNAGNSVDHLIYDSFGNVINETAPNLGLRFKYTGREDDPETGLYYYRARYYDPMGRFVSEDPLLFAAGDSSLVRYVRNVPTTFTDPSGLLGPLGFCHKKSLFTWDEEYRVDLANKLGWGYCVRVTDCYQCLRRGVLSGFIGLYQWVYMYTKPDWVNCP